MLRPKRAAVVDTTVIRTGSSINAATRLIMGLVGGIIAENHLKELYTKKALLYQHAFFVYNK